jgi:hypothetical protein
VIITDLALSTFIADVKLLITLGVEADFGRASDMINNVFEPSTTIPPSHRKVFLKKWMKLEAPLDYGQDTFQMLMRSIALTPEQVQIGLPGLETNKLSQEQFAQTLYSMGKEYNGMPIQAPIMQTGTFLPVLHIAIIFITKLCLMKSEQEKFIIQVLRYLQNIKKSSSFLGWSHAWGLIDHIKNCHGNLGHRSVYLEQTPLDWGHLH